MEIWNIIVSLFDDGALLILMIIGIISFILSMPIVIHRKKIRQIEEALPEVLGEIAENIRSAMSVESAIQEVAFVRTDLLGKELQYTCEEMQKLSFKDAMSNFATRSGSRVLARVVSLINIAIEAGTSLAEVLEKMADDLWEVIILQKEREIKTATNAAVILWGGPILTGALIGFVLGGFGGDISGYDKVIKMFIIVLGLECVLMWGVAKNQLDVALIRIPFFMFLAYLTFKLTAQIEL